MHRLRRLLGTNEAIVQSGRTVSLDCKRCFVDTWALDAAIQSAEGISRTLALYRGPFMPGDESPSSVAMRASLRSRVGRAVRDCVSVLEAGGDLSQAESVMAQALDADPAMFG